MKQKTKQLQSFLLLLILSVVSVANAWGSTTVTATKFSASQSGTTYTISAKSGGGSLSGITVKTVGSNGGDASERFKVPAGTLVITGTGNNIIQSVTITWRNESKNYPTSDSEFTSDPTGVSTTSTSTTHTFTQLST